VDAKEKTLVKLICTLSERVKSGKPFKNDQSLASEAGVAPSTLSTILRAARGHDSDVNVTLKLFLRFYELGSMKSHSERRAAKEKRQEDSTPPVNHQEEEYDM
jgi:hypothetical protein